jgi:hypothetical protein
MLDIMEDYCNFVGHPYMRLDGGTCLARRKYEIALFNSGRGGQFVYLLSTRAGALGITLTGADTVIMYDSDWNPTWDKQAHDRVHRIGQTKPVTVYQLLCQETVEERVFLRAQQKISLNEMVLRDHTVAPEDDESVKPLSGREIRTMLRCGARRILSSSNEEVDLTDADVEGIISAACSLSTASMKEEPESDDDDDVFEKEKWDIRTFEGEKYQSSKESFRSIADAWAEELARRPQKREVIATTVEVQGYKVKKVNRSDPNSSAAKAPSKKKREIVHDDLCIICAAKSKKELIKCTMSGCHRVFHQVRLLIFL